MTSAGNEDQTAAGKSAVSQGVIGLVIIFAAWGIATFVISQLQSATTETAPVVATGTCVSSFEICGGSSFGGSGDLEHCINNSTEQQCINACPAANGADKWTEGASC